MNKRLMKIIPNSLIGKIGRKTLILKKNSPTIFFVAGIAGVATSTVLACRSTLKLSETLDEMKKNIQVDMDLLEVHRIENELPDSTRYGHVAYVYSKESFKLVKLYAPAIILGTASIGALAGSHITLVRRNTALMAAYAAVQKAYDDYRDRVRDELGSERELDIYHAAKNELVQNKDGEINESKVVDPNKYSPYAKFFDEFSRHWNRDPELNRLYVQCQQNFANNLLNARGHVFLNEAYDMLGIDRSKAGAVVGWVKGGDGDNYIDFGIFEAFNSPFVNGFEQSILLDFNVDGVIYDKL